MCKENKNPTNDVGKKQFTATTGETKDELLSTRPTSFYTLLVAISNDVPCGRMLGVLRCFVEGAEKASLPIDSGLQDS